MRGKVAKRLRKIAYMLKYPDEIPGRVRGDPGWQVLPLRRIYKILKSRYKNNKGDIT